MAKSARERKSIGVKVLGATRAAKLQEPKQEARPSPLLQKPWQNSGGNTMNTPYQDQNNELINLINILSFVIGYSNLRENRQQSANNDVQAANDKQAQYLLQEINRRFDEQNKILEEQNIMLARLLELLEGKEWAII